jgi:hAT family C-terminal dimerisation region
MSRTLRERKPTFEDWETAYCLVETMKVVVDGIKFNEAKGNKWLLSDAVVNLIDVYVQNTEFADIPMVTKRAEELMDQDMNTEEMEEMLNLVHNIKRLSQLLRKAVSEKILPYLQPLIQVPNENKYHMMFAILLDPRYCYTLRPLIDLHQSALNHMTEGKTSAKNYVNQMKQKFLEYAEAAHRAAHPEVEVLTRSQTDDPIYDDDIGSGAIENRAETEFKMLRELSKSRKEDIDVLTWYESIKHQVPQMYRLAKIVFAIPPTQIQNERDFSLAGVFTRARRASMTNAMLADLMFINQNRSVPMEFNAYGDDANELDDCAIDDIEAFLDENNEIDE